MDFQNYRQLSTRSKAAIRRMVIIRGAEPTMQNLEDEARLFRSRMGWFVFDFDSTVKKCRERKRVIGIPGIEVPAFPDLGDM